MQAEYFDATRNIPNYDDLGMTYMSQQTYDDGMTDDGMTDDGTTARGTMADLADDAHKYDEPWIDVDRMDLRPIYAYSSDTASRTARLEALATLMPSGRCRNE
ncbi:hypothetical protein DF200_08130 [Bifidobacterium catulorum]|uniref:Uncharacterized protein n=2 Tax=Bifidobacterium catulorum TaxID=1630173 RepID=A0A2U2MR30_9BIFI|nr:hypothetical protein DF200_08130 [Bifidobacterium catulorum]